MLQNFTSQQLVLFIYGDLPPTQEKLLVKKIAQDESIRNEYLALLAAHELLDKSMYSPSPTSVRFILEHSCKTPNLVAALN